MSLIDKNNIQAAQTEARRVADLYQFKMNRITIHGGIGDFASRGTGSSLDFEEHRQYQPGDDPRHLDWKAFARTDIYTMKNFPKGINASL